MGYQFNCTHCHNRYKTNYGRKDHKFKSCTANSKQTGTDHKDDNLASDSESGGSSIEDMVIEEINKVRAMRNQQESLRRGQEYGITTE